MDSFDQLLQRAKTGDAAAEGQLLDRQMSSLRTFVRAKTSPSLRSMESCSDLLQSACREAIGLLRSDPSLDFEDEGRFRAWLRTVAIHKILHRAEHHAARKRSPQDSLDALPTDAPAQDPKSLTPSRTASIHEEIERIETAMEGLSADDRELIRQARFERRSTREIAAQRGVEEASVRKALARARARLWLLIRDES